MVYRVCVKKRRPCARVRGLLSDCRSFLGRAGPAAARVSGTATMSRASTAPLFDYACKYRVLRAAARPVSDAARSTRAALRRLCRRAAARSVRPARGQRGAVHPAPQPRRAPAHPHGEGLRALWHALGCDVEAVKRYVINPVESREAIACKARDARRGPLPSPRAFASVDGFTGMDESALSALLSSMGLAMDLADLKTLQAYFRDEEHRDPTVTEVRVVDTYWSDHCRHTTFSTHLDEVSIENPPSRMRMTATSPRARRSTASRRPPSAPDAHGHRDHRHQDAQETRPSPRARRERGDQRLLYPRSRQGERRGAGLAADVQNETHNHPTEIEPFGGAATCIGGCIRDPLSDVLTSIRRCASPAAATRERRSRRRFPESSPSASWRRPRRRDIRPTATRSALPRAMSPSSTTRATLPNALSAARSSPRRPPRTLCASVPPGRRRYLARRPHGP